MKWIRDIQEFIKKGIFVIRKLLWKALSFFKRWIPQKYRKKIKNILLYFYVIKGKFNPIRLEKICFFYKPEVPDFGKEFIYIKLGKKENIINPNGFSVIFEADLPDNISEYNEYFLDYSGLYALYKNNLIKEDYMLLIHYDTKILHKKWIEIINACVRKNNIVFSTWPIDNERSEVAKWIYNRIDSVFLKTHKETFLSLLKKHKISKIPNSSQFACSKERFNELMGFLLPIYEHILNENDISFKYAHLLERAWGIFFALKGYKTVSVIKDSHSQARNYDSEVINIPIMTVALEKNVKTFQEILERDR